ncbi:uncharacterized protein PFL1_04004 [Pseudozyma flocculosa PF-1]|uniref:Related to branched-chain amino acid aminotransferase n=2 Tax=Pseudozyma flocculosa TaxID=84751 RepID=A0A5C3EZ11_9BASI|nr:uncharacterized protein PFL1_04004 [Pseudozyma flocculosa PF-1]EPQ28701.1 hypothetical protein PFL1_04004 [Pseudozyma flocculosa PF-1]SPO36657.1 related to branched-chain amino acid aminotransferase [Pseudozyma flocculosa]
MSVNASARQATPPSSSVDWDKLGFTEREVNAHVRVTYKDGQWGKPALHTGTDLNVHYAAPCLNYGQQAFEGIKAFRTKAGSVHIFRPQENFKRINLSASVASMPALTEAVFFDSLKAVVAANLEYVPPYQPNASGGALYIRPLLLATGPRLLLDSPDEFTFVIWVSPVGSLYGSAKAIPAVDGFVLDTFDRTAPMGTGHTKLGGNYAPVFKPTREAKKRGFPITLHLDSATRTYIDEFSTSNALAIKRHGDATTLVVPESTSILRSVTKISVVDIAKKLLGWNVELRPVAFQEVKDKHFDEFLAAGTAAGVTPVRSMSYNTKQPRLVSGGSTEEPHGPRFDFPPDNVVERIDFGDGKTAGEGAKVLFDQLTSYQCGDQEDVFGWLWPAEGIVAEDASAASS